jgi:hypothetical protein
MLRIQRVLQSVGMAAGLMERINGQRNAQRRP